MRQICLFALFSVFIFVGSHAQQNSELDEINRLYDNNQFDEAIALIKNSSEKETTMFQFHLANCFQKKGELELALSTYEGLDFRVENKVLLNRGICNYNLDNYDESYADFVRYFEFQPEDPKVHFYLGVIEYSLNRYNEAMTYVNNALEIDDSYPEALNLFGACLLEKNRPEEAKVYFEKSLELDPENEMMAIHLAVTLINIEDFFGANDILDNIIAKDNEEKAEALYWKGVSLFESDDQEGACEAWTYSSELGIDEAGQNVKNICLRHKTKVKQRKVQSVEF